MTILYGVIAVAVIAGVNAAVESARTWVRSLQARRGVPASAVIAGSKLMGLLTLRITLIAVPSMALAPGLAARPGVEASDLFNWLAHQLVWTAVAAGGFFVSHVLEVQGKNLVARRHERNADHAVSDIADLYAAKRDRSIEKTSQRHYRAITRWTEAGAPGGREIIDALDEALSKDVTQHATPGEYEHAVTQLEHAVDAAVGG